MPCGCSGSTWQPPSTPQEGAKSGESPKEPAAPKWSPSGPGAPGYYWENKPVDGEAE